MNNPVKKPKPPKKFRFRLTVLYSLVFLSFTSLILRESYLQVAKGAAFRSQEKTQLTERVPILPERGWIYDANGKVLADDVPTASVILNRFTPLPNSEYLAMAKVLAPVFHTTEQSLYKKMSGNPGIWQIPIAPNATNQQISFIWEHQSEFPNVQVVRGYQRDYPNGDLAGQVLGYIGNITPETESFYAKQGYSDIQQVGISGLESQYEPLMQGKPGYELETIDSPGKAAAATVPPMNGQNIQLSLDGHLQANTQMIIQNLINKAPNKSTIVDASAVMLNVKNGGVLAMASYPYLDPNWYNNGTWTQHENYLSTSGAQLNNVIQTIGYPGSTVKPANLLTAMKSNIMSASTSIFDNGYIYIGASKINEDMGMKFGWLDPVRAIAVSSDVFFYQLGLEFGKWFGSSDTSGGSYPASDGSYQHYLNTDFIKGMNALFQGEWDFGLGQLTGIDLPNEIKGTFYIEDSSKGYTQEPYNLQNGEKSVAKTGQFANNGTPESLADAGIGQSQQFTPMELGEYAMTLADDGTKLKPHLLSSVYNSDGTPTNGTKPVSTVKTTVEGHVDASTADFQLVKEAMHDVTTGSDSTAYGVFNNAPYQVAAKTGTAQIVINGQATDNSVFICYAPLDHPLVAAAIMVPGGGYGASLAGVIARQMIDAYFDEHHEPFMPKSQWTNTDIPSNWKQSSAYEIPEQSH